MNGTTISVLFLSFISLNAQGALLTIERIEAAVNSSVILLSDVLQFRKTVRLRSQLDPIFSGTTLATKGASAPDIEIVRFLADEKLVTQEFAVTEAEVEQEINSIQASNNIDRPALKDALRDQGFTYQDYFDLIQTSIAKKNLIDRDIRTKVHISDDDVKNYFYNDIRRDLGADVAYHVFIIRSSYQNYRTKNAAFKASQRAYQAVINGEPFEEVAKRLSDDYSAPSGGDLGILHKDDMSSELISAVEKLGVGQSSGVLEDLETGYYIVKLKDLKTGQETRLESRAGEIRNTLIAKEYQRQITLWLERQRDGGSVHFAGTPSVGSSH